MTRSPNGKETMMGMDIYGNEPKNECGKYFGITAWGWRPLVTYMRELAPEITAKCKLWFYSVRAPVWLGRWGRIAHDR
jgi:hypothetical protein